MTPEKKVGTQFRKLMAALQVNSHSRFVALGDANFRAKITPQMVKKVSAQLSPRMNRAHIQRYLGYISAPRFVDHLWKLTFADDNGDRLAQLSVKGGKVHAFYVF
jgi:hypothetical protein